MTIDNLKEKIDQLIQSTPLAGIPDDLKLLLQSQLQSLLTNANLVSREEFDVQAEILQRTKSNLAALETRISELENKL